MKPLVLFILIAVNLTAQVSGRLTGSVTDPSGAAVPGATVNLMLAGGSKPVLTTTTTAEGLFSMTGIRPAAYDLTIEAAGFLTYKLGALKVDPARESSIPRVQLEVAAVTQTVDVSASEQTVQTSNAEISTTVTNAQVRRLPMLDRDPISLITTQAGVSSGRGATVINGQRSSYSNVTLDGINIQDNYIRSGGLDYQPNLLLLDQVAEFTISTSNTNSTVGGGASQITFISPSGGNQFHGAALWYNRNNAVAAGDWFDNKDGIAKAFLNQNQAGGSLGGPIRKDKLFFYFNYEAFRNRQKDSANRTILTSEARSGVFTYIDTSGVVRKVNVLTAASVPLDPAIQQLLTQVPGPEKINNFRRGDSSSSLVRNTGGYSFAVRDNRTRDNVTGKLDYVHSTKHVFAGSYAWNRELVDRADYSSDYSPTPKVTNHNTGKLLSASWRWNPTPQIVNELRGGFNLAPGTFDTTEKFGEYLLDGLIFDNPVNPFRFQGRDTNTYSLSDNATYTRGRHTFQFGFQMQQIRIRLFDEAGITPTFTVTPGTGNAGLRAAQLPGSRAADRAAANNLLASLAGYIDSYAQTFNVTSRTSGFVPNAGLERKLTLDNYAGFLHDSWKVSPRLTLTLGVRYEYFTPVNESNAIALLPVIQNNNPIQTLLSNSSLNFAGRSVGRPFYNSDRNNFAPNIGLAWDIFGTGKTSLRAGYSISYVNDDVMASVDNNVYLNAGLASTVQDFGLTARVSNGRPVVPKPVFKVPRTFADNYAEDSTSAFGMPDPGLRTPYVQQWNIGIQHSFKGNLFEVRYVANHATKALRSFDYNQVQIRENGFLGDFQRALNNGNLARAATGTFNPAYNSAIPGSQPLPVFNQIEARGDLSDSTISGLIERGEVGGLAALYQIDGYTVPFSFFRNANALGTNMLTNYSNSTYNSLQVDLRRRTDAGLNFQVNYTFSKVLSDAAGDGELRFEPFLDINNASVERARAPFDLRHAIKANFVYELPIGKGHRVSSSRMRWALDGWSVSSLLTKQSGTPFSVLSGRATLNRSGLRSETNTANTALTKSDLDRVVGFHQTGDGPFFIDPTAIGTDGRGVGPDGQAAFRGQVFTNPGPGAIGALQRRMFSGPWTFSMDAGVQKLTKLTERQSLEFRMEATNVFNHPAFYVGDESADITRFNINSTTFGRINSTFANRRVIQFGLYYRF